MKGTPLIRLLVVLGLMTLTAWPVIRMTASVNPHASNAGTIPKQKPDSKAQRITVVLNVEASPGPLHCEIKQADRTLLGESNRISPSSFRSTETISPDEDLLIKAEWSDDAPHAVRVMMLPGGDAIGIDKTYRAGRSLFDSFPVDVLTNR